MIPAIQLLAHGLDNEARGELDSQIGVLLREAQTVAHGMTDSGAEQICQIIPQVLTDQLIAGPISWRQLTLSRGTLGRLLEFGKIPEYSVRFETPLSLSIHFLIYYRASLGLRPARNRHASLWRDQGRQIDEYLSTLARSTNPIHIQLRPWIQALTDHTSYALQHSGPYRRLARQSSVIVTAKYLDTSPTSEALWRLCVLNNLRAAVQSIGLSDQQDRWARVKKFLSENGVGRDEANRIISELVPRSRKGFRDGVAGFIEELPKEIERPTPDGRYLSTYSGYTMNEIWADLTRFRVWQDRHKAVFDIPADRVARATARTVWRLVRNLRTRSDKTAFRARWTQIEMQRRIRSLLGD